MKKEHLLPLIIDADKDTPIMIAVIDNYGDIDYSVPLREIKTISYDPYNKCIVIGVEGNVK
jgi:hypothetical protein